MNHRMGGHFKDVPEPYKTLWPDSDKKRIVTVSCISWVGLSIGAKHWYAELIEEDNYIIDGDTLQVCWDHPEELRGLRIDEREAFTEEADARSWLRRMYKKHFDDGKHEPYFVEGEPDWWF